jgi:hypothetical protein
MRTTVQFYFETLSLVEVVRSARLTKEIVDEDAFFKLRNPDGDQLVFGLESSLGIKNRLVGQLLKFVVVEGSVEGNFGRCVAPNFSIRSAYG